MAETGDFTLPPEFKRAAEGNTQPEPELMLLPEVATMTRLSEDTIRWLRHTGEGPKSGKLGRRVVYRRSDVQTWIDAGFDRDEQPASA
jgi:predicted DNA-binding transcriptional regulator AlpA